MHSSKFKLKSLQVSKLKDKNPVADGKDCCKNGGEAGNKDGGGEDVGGGGWGSKGVMIYWKMNRQTDKWRDIGDCRVAFATETTSVR